MQKITKKQAYKRNIFYELCLWIYILQNNVLFNSVLIKMKMYLLQMFEFYFAQSKQCLGYCCWNMSEKKGSILELFYKEMNERSKYRKHFFFYSNLKRIIQSKDMTFEVFFLSLLRTLMQLMLIQRITSKVKAKQKSFHLHD